MNWLRSSTNQHPMDRKKLEPGMAFTLLKDHWAQAESAMNRAKVS